MIKFCWLIFGSLMVTLLFGSAAHASVAIYKDGTKLQTTNQPIQSNGSTFVPMRDLFTAYKASINYSNKNQTVYAKTAAIQIEVRVGSKQAKVNGKNVFMSAAPIIKNQTVYVPLRFVSEAFHSNVGFAAIQSSSFITINTSAYESMKITHVRDGDTFEGTYLSGSEKGKSDVIRLIGVDTPETVKENTPVQFYGPEASAYTKSQLSNKTVYIVKDRTNDTYDRTLAYVFLENGQFYNAQLMTLGYARALAIEPNTKWKSLFQDIQDIAVPAKIGVWSEQEEDLLTSLHLDGAQISEEQLLRLLIVLLFPETKTIFYAEKFYQLSQDEQFKETVKIAVDRGIIASNSIMNHKGKLTVSDAIDIIGGAYKLNPLVIKNLKAVAGSSSYLSTTEALEIINKIKGMKDKVVDASTSLFDSWINH